MGRQTARRVLVIAALAVTVAFAWAGSASALVYGIQGDAYGWGGGYLERFADLGVTHAREEFDHEDRPTDYDAFFEEAAHAGIVLLPVIGSGTGVPAAGTPDGTAYTTFVRDFVHRFGPHGAFWRANPSLPQLWPTHFDIWNEPYADPIASAGTYAGLFVATVRAARTAAGNPAARFLLEADISSIPASSSFPGCVGGPASGQDWIGAMYAAQPSLGDYVDGFSVHPYGNDPADAYDELFPNCAQNRWLFQRIEEIRERLDAQGEATKPFWITEIGHPSDGCSNCSLTEQDDFMAGYIAGAQALDYVDGFFPHHFRETCTDTGNKECWFGLAYHRSTTSTVFPKPAYTTYASAIASDPPDVTAPARPTGTTASVTLRWSANSPADDVLDYVVYRDGAPIAHVTGTSYVDTGFDPAAGHDYAITARDHAGNESPVAP